jgi:membrane-associated protease RseP (regulator of RpoE activity)
MSRMGGGIPGANLAWWQDAFIYMAAVMGILLSHEMGHFIQAVRYKVPASLPFFIPMPALFSPTIGTMGAVIGLQGTQANRKELFDIGLTGPIAGLMVALPVTAAGILLGKPYVPVPGYLYYNYADPLVVQWMINWLRPEVAGGTLTLNPLLLAGWVGMLITGLNMLPVSQLDGGHVIYALFGKKSYYIARLFILAAIAFIVISNQLNWIVMLLLVMMIGIEHPPTSDDTVSLGWFRRVIGVCSLAIPILCFTPIPYTAGVWH